jgi:hypothetical protein
MDASVLLVRWRSKHSEFDKIAPCGTSAESARTRYSRRTLKWQVNTMLKRLDVQTIRRQTVRSAATVTLNRGTVEPEEPILGPPILG